MRKKYLKRVYAYGKLVKYEIVSLPVDVGSWQESVKLDRRDGFNTTYKTSVTTNGLSRVVVSSRAEHLSTRVLYLYDLISSEGKGKQLLDYIKNASKRVMVRRFV